ncbi:MAG: DUF2100 domain-containing protein [Candidatus Jordarchaeaceae archaeon]
MIFGYEDIVRINSALDALIAILCRVRAFAPRYNFDSATEEEIKKYFKTVQDALNLSINRTVEEPREKSIEVRTVDFKDVDFKGILFITVSSSTRRKLLDLGIDPRFVVVTGGPLDVADFKSLNPNMSDVAIDTVRRKVETVWRDIERKTQEVKKILVLAEKDNKGDLMVAEKVDEIRKRTGLKTFVKTFSSLKDLSLEFFEEFLGDGNV